MEKRLISIVLSAAIILTVLSGVFAVSAASDAVISCSDASIAPEETSTVNVSIANNPGIMAMRFSISYDTDNLELVADASLVDGYTLENEGNTYLFWGKADYTADGAFAAFTFAAKDEATAGDYDFTITLVDAGDFNEKLVDATTEGSTITIKEASAQVTLGDVDGNGKVTAEDVTTLARHVARIAEITDADKLAAGNVDKDNEKITAEDVTKLARYVARIITSLD